MTGLERAAEIKAVGGAYFFLRLARRGPNIEGDYFQIINQLTHIKIGAVDLQDCSVFIST